MDKDTFGNFKMSHILIEMLDRDGNKKLKSKVCKHITRYINDLQQLRLLTDKTLQEILMIERRNYYQKLFKDVVGIIENNEMFDFLNGLIITLYREEYRKIKRRQNESILL